MAIDRAEVGKIIRKYRIGRGMSIEELAFCSGISSRYLGSVERHGTKVSLEVLLGIIEGLELTNNEACELFTIIRDMYTLEGDDYETANAGWHDNG